jgi:hypothetical protein
VDVLLVAMLTIVGLVVTSAVLVAVIIRRVARRVRRRVTVITNRAGLHARAYGVGPTAQAARLRLELMDALRRTSTVLAIARTNGWSVGDAPMLLRRLQDSAATVDVELRGLELEPDVQRATAALPDVRTQVQTLTQSATALRLAVLERGRNLAEAEIDGLGRDCAVEAQALRTAATPLG